MGYKKKRSDDSVKIDIQMYLNKYKCLNHFRALTFGAKKMARSFERKFQNAQKIYKSENNRKLLNFCMNRV